MRTLSELDVYKRLPITIVSGEGVYVQDDAGHSYLDLYGGHAAALLGHSHPALVEVLCQQARTLFFQTNAVDLAVRAEAAEALGSLFPAALTKVFFVNSGAEANENALRLALRLRPGRDTVVAFEGSFHGRTAAAAAVTTGSETWYGFPQRPFATRYVPVDDPAALFAAVDERVAAVIVEPVQGVAGARAISDAVLQAARQACDAAGALLISDEVQCGLGRSGSTCAIAGADVVPDLVTLGKGIAGGFPAAAMLCTDAIAEEVHPGDLGTTFGGGPLACALIAEVARQIVEEGLADHAVCMHSLIASTCKVGPVVSVEGAGLLVALRTKGPAAKVVAGLREHGILAGTASDPHVVRLMPPLTIGPEHIHALAEALEAL